MHPFASLRRCLLLVLASAATCADAAQGDLVPGAPAVVAERTDLAVAGVGDLGAPASQGGGAGELLLEGVDGDVTLALLYWHGIDISWPVAGLVGGNADYDEAEVVFAGQPITGTRVAGGGYDNNWGDHEAPDPNAFSAALYRADVTHLVGGSGSYTLAGLADGAGHSASGASLVVFHDDGNDDNDVRVEHYEAMDSNLDTLVGHQWHALLPVAYAGGKVELLLHVADGQTSAADGGYRARVFPGLLPRESTDFEFESPHVDGEPLWGGRSVPRMGFGRRSPGGGLWDIRRFDLTAAFHAPGPHAVYGVYEGGGSDYVTLVSMQLVQSLPGRPLGLTPWQHDFGDLEPGTSSAVQRFTLLNRHADPITAGSVTRGHVAFAVLANTCSGSVLAPGDSCTIDVQCTPAAARDHAATLEVAWEDAFGRDFGSSARMRCAGVGEGSYGRVAVEPPQAWFGTVTPGSTSTVRRFTVSSIGNAAVSLHNLRRSGVYAAAFAPEADGCTGTTLAPGATCSFDLRFRPPADRGLGSLYADVEVEFTTSGAFHIGVPVPVAGTVVPDERTIFRDGFEPH